MKSSVRDFVSFLSSLVRRQTAVAALSTLAVLAAVAPAVAAPEAHILRIDPRASLTDGAPIITTVVEVVQNKRMSDLTSACAVQTGDANLDCVANALEQPQALYSPFDFPDKNAILTVAIDGTDTPASFLSKTRWGDLANQPHSGAGTAWLILIDAAATMGPRFDEAKAVAGAFVNAMGPNDIVDIMFFNDRAVVHDSKWVNTKQAGQASLNAVPKTYPTQGRTRPLGTILKTAVTDGFKELGNAGQSVQVPMHQALVVLSNGAAGADPSSNAVFSNVLRDYLTKGRFPENNDVLPKTPVPTVSIWFPSRQIEEFGANAREFMEGLANTEIGGFFSVVRERQEGRATNIVNAVRSRFNKMHVVKWRVSCVAPSISQTFKLFFNNTSPPIAGDTFQNVPVGIDPSAWPLDIDREATEAAAKKNPIYPGGTVRILGNFCWGGNAQRAEIYMISKNQPAPPSLANGTIEDAKRAQKTLIEAGLRGKALTAGDSVVEFELPSNEVFLAGKGESMVARMVLYDNQAHRTSAIAADKVLTLRASAAPFPILLIGGVTFGGVVLILLVVNLMRGGGGKRRTAPQASMPRPVVAGQAPAPFNPAPFQPMGATMTVARATLSGGVGVFTIVPGMEMRAGRDASACQIVLAEPRVSGTHATIKIDGGQLVVRDEGSNNGTWINGTRVAAQTWSPVPQGAALRFGPAEFSVRLE